MIPMFRTPALFALCIAPVLVTTSCAKRSGPPTRPPSPVQTAVAVTMDAPMILTGFGTTSERASVDIVPQVSGMLLKRYFEDGAIVTNGQPLFLLDPADYALRVRQAESMLVANRANRDLARLTLDRSRALYEKKLISQEDFDTLQARLDAANAQVTGDESALDQARLNLSRCAINAPMDGVCSRRFLDEGNLAAAGMTRLTNIRSYNPITVDFALSEEFLSAIRHALQTPPVRIEVIPRGGTNCYAGALVFMDNAVSPQTGTIALRGEIPNADLKLWANQYAEVRVFAGIERNAVMVPEGAVQYGKMGAYLFRVAPNNFTLTTTNTPTRLQALFGAKPVVITTNFVSDAANLRPVQTGLRYNDLIQIGSGVAAGERIVVLGQLRIVPGAPVADLSQQPSSATPSAAPKPGK